MSKEASNDRTRCPFCNKPIAIMKYRTLAKLGEGYCHNENHLVTYIGMLLEELEEASTICDNCKRPKLARSDICDCIEIRKEETVNDAFSKQVPFCCARVDEDGSYFYDPCEKHKEEASNDKPSDQEIFTKGTDGSNMDSRSLEGSQLRVTNTSTICEFKGMLTGKRCRLEEGHEGAHTIWTRELMQKELQIPNTDLCSNTKCELDVPLDPLTVKYEDGSNSVFCSYDHFKDEMIRTWSAYITRKIGGLLFE